MDLYHTLPSLLDDCYTDVGSATPTNQIFFRRTRCSYEIGRHGEIRTHDLLHVKEARLPAALRVLVDLMRFERMISSM